MPEMTLKIPDIVNTHKDIKIFRLCSIVRWMTTLIEMINRIQICEYMYSTITNYKVHNKGFVPLMEQHK